MASRADFERMNALIAEGITLCEAAQQRFEEINADLQKAIRDGRRLTSKVLADEAQARTRLNQARVQLSERLRKRRRLIEKPVKDEDKAPFSS
jgi:hypothetical protein